MKELKITVRATAEECEQSRQRAESASMSVNRYRIDSALHPMPRNDRQLSLLMGQLCRLENHMRGSTDFYELQKKVSDWRQQTMKIMEGC